MSLQHVHDPQMTIHCSLLRGMAYNEHNVRKRFRDSQKAGKAHREAGVQEGLVV